MTPSVSSLPLLGVSAGFRRFSVAEYHRLAEFGILTEDDNLELLEGYLVHKISRNPAHDGTLHRLLKQLGRIVPEGWWVRVQAAVTLIDSEPEPDLAVVRADATEYMHHHPTANDLGLVIEVSDSTLAGDRADRTRIYARAGIPCYWIVNLVDRQIEVYSSPTGGDAPNYGLRADYRGNMEIDLILQGKHIAHIPVTAILS